MNSLEFAIRMEVDGEIYYAEQAQLHLGDSLGTVFLMLSRDERIHAETLRKRAAEGTQTLPSNETYRESVGVFRNIRDFGMETKISPDQLDVYLAALENERRSIELYQEMMAEATDEADRILFGDLIRQEKEHYRILDDLTLLLNRPKEWVESAEFGIREDY